MWDFHNYDQPYASDASRYELGTPNLIGTLALTSAIELMNRSGKQRIADHILMLTDRLCEGLQSAGAQLSTLRGDGISSGIVTFRMPGCESVALGRALGRLGVVTTWRRNGIRVAPHGYNTPAESTGSWNWSRSARTRSRRRLERMLATLSILAALSGQPALPAGTFRYAGALAGASVGTTTLTVTPGDGSTQIAEVASGSAGGLAFSGTASLLLGADLAPTQYDGAYTIAGRQTKVSLALTPTTATLRGAGAGDQAQTFPLDPHAKHFVVIEPGLMAGLFALPAQMRAWDGTPVTGIAPVFGRVESLAPELSAAPPARPNGVPASDQELSVGASVPFVVWYDPTTLIPDQIAVPSQNLTATRVRD